MLNVYRCQENMNQIKKHLMLKGTVIHVAAILESNPETPAKFKMHLPFIPRI